MVEVTDASNHKSHKQCKQVFHPVHEFGDFDGMRGDRLDRLHNNKYKKIINDYSIFSNVDGQAVMLVFRKVQKPFFAATSTKTLRWQHHATRRTHYRDPQPGNPPPGDPRPEDLRPEGGKSP